MGDVYTARASMQFKTHNLEKNTTHGTNTHYSGRG